MSAEGKLEPTVQVLVDDENLKITEGSAANLKWKIQGIYRNTNCYPLWNEK